VKITYRETRQRVTARGFFSERADPERRFARTAAGAAARAPFPDYAHPLVAIETLVGA
jgi:hypothetical protein